MDGMKRIDGIFTPIPTPFAASGDVDTAALRRNVARWMATPLDGLVILGSNGEAAQLEDDEADRVLASLKETWPGIDWHKLSGYMIERVVTHGKRRAAEMREVSETLQSIGMEPVMAAATAARQQWIADLGVKERLAGRKTEDRATLVKAIREAMGK